VHPLLDGRFRTGLYVGTWTSVGLLLALLLSRLEGRAFAHALAFVGPLTLFYASMCLSAWWVCKGNPIGAVPTTRLLASLVGSCLLTAGAWVVLGGFWGGFLASRFHVGPPPGDPAGVRDLVFLGVSGVVLYSQSIVLHYVLLVVENARAIERRLLESQVSAREAELRALRAQLNPHFLFNSLNSISALTGPDPEAARRMCQLLGDFLRTSLALGARGRVAFGEELALAERYLAIEQVRFGARLGFEKSIDPAAEPCLVPPLLIQPLVENAVKHGVADRVEGGVVTIGARRVGEGLVITVENPRDPDAPPRRGHGLGLENVRQRLAALDPKSTRCEVHQDAERFQVTLTLPAIMPAEAAAPNMGVRASAAGAPAVSTTAALPRLPGIVDVG
jgi:hypothetical protein